MLIRMIRLINLQNVYIQKFRTRHLKYLTILNGNIIGDKCGKYTYISTHGNSVIDYVIISAESYVKYLRFTVTENILSPHMPLELEIFANTNFIGNRSDKVEDTGSGFKWQHHLVTFS